LFAVIRQVFNVGRETVEKLDSKVTDSVYERELANYIEESSS